jgi:hypothetical protein
LPGLRVDKVLYGAPGQRREALLNLPRADLHDGGGTIWIDQGAGRFYVDLGYDGKQAEAKILGRGQDRMHIQCCRKHRKAGLAGLHAVDAVRQLMDGEFA